ncbi:MAG: M1 family aminopeptidase [Acidimicrobiales bacterium]
MAALTAACSSSTDGSGDDGIAASPLTSAPRQPGGAAEPAVPSTDPAATQASGNPCTTTPTRRPPDPNRPRYTMSLDISPPAAAVDGSIDVRFAPDFDTDKVVFRLWPNGPRQLAAGTLLTIVGPVEVDGKEAATSQDDISMLVIRPGGTIRAGQTVQVKLGFHIRLARARDRISGEADSVRLGSFFPILEYEPGTGWTTDPPTIRFAEASTAPAADFDLTINTPPGYTAIASGKQDRAGHWTATGMRDVSVAVGRFTTLTGVANAPDPVEVLVGVSADAGDVPKPYLDRAIAVLEASSKRFGPYPWPTFAVSVTPGTSTGIEYPGHILHGPDTATDILTHEVAHQWFYALVGNNQARDPWLDEALTTWVEARYENTVGDYKAMAIPADVRGKTTEPMAFFDLTPNFYLGAYVQGIQALAALGEPDQVDCALRLYAADNAYRIAKAADLFKALERVFPDARTTLARYGIRP